MPIFSSDSPTVRDPFDPFVARVLSEARARLGREEEAQNRGAIVREVCAPFLSPERFEEAYAAGKLAWCAAFAGFCWWLAWPGFKPYLSLRVPVFWDRLTAAGWTRVRGVGELPQAGDLIFRRYRSGLTLRHVELVADVGKLVHTIGGNRNDHGSPGIVAEGHYSLDDPLTVGYATPRPG